jgi:predicted anti-sigma-YlaC factor YlaD
MDDHHECKDCQKIFDKLSEYIDRELTEDECLIFEEHIQNCKPCLDFLESLNYTVKLCHHIEGHETFAIPRDVSLKLHDFLKKECKTS